MNRQNRTLIVLLIAVGLASAATYFVYRAITRIPVRQVEVASLYVAVAAENLPLGHAADQGADQAGRLAVVEPGPGQLRVPGRAGRPRPDSAGARERAADREQAGPGRGRRRSAAVDSAGHARVVGAGERRDRRRRLHHSGHTRRRAGHVEPGEGQHVARRRQQRAGADRRHALRPGAVEGRQGDPVDGRDA